MIQSPPGAKRRFERRSEGRGWCTRTSDVQIGQYSTEKGLVLYISGRLTKEDLELVRMALDGRRLVAIDLAEVELVSRDAVKLLAQAEAERIELGSCPAYIREWVTNERESNQRVVADGTGCWRKLLRRSL